MDLQDAVVPRVAPARPKAQGPPKKKEPQVAAADKAVCSTCRCLDSGPTPANTCSICATTWKTTDDEEEDASELLEALDLLHQACSMFDRILATPKLIKRLKYKDEIELRDLALSIGEHLADYEDVIFEDP